MNAKNIVQGAATLAEWIGSGGKPVSELDSERRAMICTSCVKNQEPHWFDRMVAGPAADRVKRHLQARTDIGLTTSVDDDLNICKVCDCVLTLKVHVPLEHIVNHTSKEQLDAFPSNCWIPAELKEKGLSI